MHLVSTAPADQTLASEATHPNCRRLRVIREAEWRQPTRLSERENVPPGEEHGAGGRGWLSVVVAVVLPRSQLSLSLTHTRTVHSTIKSCIVG